MPARDVGTFLLRGKRLPVRVLEPLAASGGQFDDESLAAFAAATTSFRAARGRRRTSASLRSRHGFPADGPSRVLRALGARVAAEPSVALDRSRSAHDQIADLRRPDRVERGEFEPRHRVAPL